MMNGSGRVNNYRVYYSPCCCRGPERVLTPLVGPVDARVQEIAKEYLKPVFYDFRENHNEGISVVGASVSYGLVVGALVGAPILVVPAIITLAATCLFGKDLSSPYDRNLVQFLVDEYLRQHPTASNNEIFDYIRTEIPRFYSYKCENHPD
jgi:hypothetical protein